MVQSCEVAFFFFPFSREWTGDLFDVLFLDFRGTKQIEESGPTVCLYSLLILDSWPFYFFGLESNM